MWNGSSIPLAHEHLAWYVKCGLRMRRECRERFLLRRAWGEPSAAGQLWVFGLTNSPLSTAKVLIDAVGYVCPYELFWSSFEFRMKLVYISYELPIRTFEIILVLRKFNPFQMKFTWTDQHDITYEWYHPSYLVAKFMVWISIFDDESDNRILKY